MAKPRVFVSSTYYDLKHIRNSLEAFIESLGYEAVLFESGDIPFHHDAPIDESCYGEIQSCHMLVLIIGGRYGSPSSDDGDGAEVDLDRACEAYNSITKKEYEAARGRDIPIFIFVEKNVLAEYQTYKDNRENTSIIYHHVDSTNIYGLLDDILAQRRNNFVRGFEEFDDIAAWLRDQWAGLFADFVSRRSEETTLRGLGSQIAALGEVAGVLKTYTESIMRKVKPEHFETIISRQEQRLLQSHIRSFSSDGMIPYLLLTGRPKASAEDLYKALESSASLLDFLHRAGFAENYMQEFLETFEVKGQGKRDYGRLMDRYFGSGRVDGEGAEPDAGSCGPASA